jgi:hypothetical protein
MLPLLGPGSSAPARALPNPRSLRLAFPGIAPRTVDRLTSATTGFDFSNGVMGGSDSAQLIIETNATRFTSGFVSAFNTGSATMPGNERSARRIARNINGLQDSLAEGYSAFHRHR